MRLRLDKWLANSGLGTRTEVKKAIREGRVSVNGEAIRDPGRHVVLDDDSVAFDGDPIAYEPFVYLMMYKPQGVVSATEDKRDAVVTDLLRTADSHLNVFPVGRLDKDAEGLLLLTDDGQLAHRLLSPKKHVPKRYLVHVSGHLTDDDGRTIASGIVLDDGYVAMPAELNILRSDDTSISDATSIAEIVIYEGKFHQVKRMFEALGKPVLFLKRLQMGSLQLDASLTPGEYRSLTPDELALLSNPHST